MNVRRHLGLIVAGGISLVLVLVLAVLLVRFQREYQRVRSGLQAAESRLQRLYERVPYPSEANVAIVQTNLAALQDFYQKLCETLRLGQIDPIIMEPADFPPLLDRTIKRLYEKAREGGVKLPPRFAFGFERYALGSLPNKEDVARLTVQLRTVEKICEVVFKEKVNEIAGVERVVFEKGVIERTEGGGRRRGYAESEVPDRSAEEWKDPSGLFARETYTMSFVASDAAVVSVLNALAKSGLIAVVSSVELVGEVPQVKAPESVTASGATPSTSQGVAAPPPSADSLLGGAAPAAPAAKEPPPHEERIVAGRAMVKASIQIRVYRLLSGANSQENPS
jgi:hypothetical protein